MQSVEVDSTNGDEAAAASPAGRRGYLSVLPVALATGAVAHVALRAVLDRCGHPAVPLDDAFIHFQYAKRLAAGHFFSYTDGQAYSSGATSVLWPLLLAPFYALGFQDLSIVWVAWFFGFWALFALAVETYRLALPLAGQGASAGACAMVLCFGGYVWCAASGMEVVPLSWALAFALRRCIEWWESSPNERTRRRRRVLVAAAWLAPLLRPEGMLASVLVFATIAFAAPLRRAERGLAPQALVGALLVPVTNVLLTGRWESSTAVVKWLPGNPYYGHGTALFAAIGDNVRTLFVSILDGRDWGAVFIPGGARPVAMAALVAIPITGYLRRRTPRAVLVLGMALALLVPCTYTTFLWNRLRYLWPFAFAWFVGLACLARCIGMLFGRLKPRLSVLSPVTSGAFAGALLSHFPWTVDDLATSASAIDRQQVALGRWAAGALAPDARIGLNDAGAIGYLSGRKTFDVVGLTTSGEARYWVAGAGSRFEHYERLFRADTSRLPTHFIVYPHWMACDALLGDELRAETVVDQTILGGTTMVAFAARYDLLGSGERPSVAPSADLIDELDVADLESEGAHGYELGVTHETEDQALVYREGERMIADGARISRARDRFVLRGPDKQTAVLVARVVADRETVLEVRADDTVLGTVPVGPTGGWSEFALGLPRAGAEASMAMSITALHGGRFGSAHYWLYRTGPPSPGPSTEPKGKLP